VSTTSLFEEKFLVRLSFLFAAGFMFAEGLQNWIRGDIETHPEVVLLLLVTYAIAFVLFVLATIDSARILRLRDLALVALVVTVIVSWYVITQVEHPGSYQTDALAYAHYSAILFSKGINPYTQDLDSALTMFSVSPQFFTLTPSGNLVNTLNYPALQFLVLLPVVWLGIRDARIIIYVFEFASLLVIYFWSPKEIRPIVLIPLFAGSDLAVNFSAGAIADFLWVLPLVIMVVCIDRPWLAGVFYGLACAVKQTPWLLAPFLIVWFVKAQDHVDAANKLRSACSFVMSALLAFLVPNIWFMWLDFSAWYSGVMIPALGNLVVLSQGLSLLTLAIGVPLPPDFYLFCTVLVGLTLLVNYYVYFDKLKLSLWAFPAIMLWFSYRGLQNYFVFWAPLLVMSLICLYRRKDERILNR
jgi:uncharacterized membrane protein